MLIADGLTMVKDAEFKVTGRESLLDRISSLSSSSSQLSCRPPPPTHVISAAGAWNTPAQLATDSNTVPTTTTGAAAGVGVGGTAKVIFPLKDLFEPHVACRFCYTDGKVPVTAPHSCRQDILVVESRQTAGAWFRIRERINHVSFQGKYHLCNNRPNYAIGRCCPRGESCTFAHNEVERALWIADKMGQFNICEFISQAGSRSEVKLGHTIQSLMAKYPGQLAFLCQECYLFSRCRVSMQSPANPSLCSVEAHDWSMASILAHCALNTGTITLVSRYPASSSSESSALCLMGGFCQERWRGECSHAHSMVEREVWSVQKDTGLSQQQIVKQVTSPH